MYEGAYYSLAVVEECMMDTEWRYIPSPDYSRGAHDGELHGGTYCTSIVINVCTNGELHRDAYCISIVIEMA